MERQEREEKTCVEGTKKVGTEMQHPALHLDGFTNAAHARLKSSRYHKIM